VHVDSHCHLDDADFDNDRDAVIERARAFGVGLLLTIGGVSGPDSMAASVPFADSHEWIWAAGGIHPHEASKAEDRHFDELRRLAQHPKFVAIGEIGLDYYYDHSPRDVQQQVLVRQLELARELKLPVIIHCRDAWSDLRDLPLAVGGPGRNPALLLGYAGRRFRADGPWVSGFLCREHNFQEGGEPARRGS
jgi:TatD DNase family protein